MGRPAKTSSVPPKVFKPLSAYGETIVVISPTAVAKNAPHPLQGSEAKISPHYDKGGDLLRVYAYGIIDSQAVQKIIAAIKDNNIKKSRDFYPRCHIIFAPDCTDECHKRKVEITREGAQALAQALSTLEVSVTQIHGRSVVLKGAARSILEDAIIRHPNVMRASFIGSAINFQSRLNRACAEHRWNVAATLVECHENPAPMDKKSACDLLKIASAAREISKEISPSDVSRTVNTMANESLEKAGIGRPQVSRLVKQAMAVAAKL